MSNSSFEEILTNEGRLIYSNVSDSMLPLIRQGRDLVEIERVSGRLKRYGRHFSDEDFYVYMIAHEYKHYSGGGTGLRSLLDTYVYLKAKGETLDRTYIAGELDKLGIAGFEAQNRSLAMHLFGGEKLTGQDEEMLEYILSSGTYGTVRNSVKNSIKRYGSGRFGKLRYVMSRLFLPMNTVRATFPLFAKYPILLPFLPLYRVFRGLTSREGRLRAELKALA